MSTPLVIRALGLRRTYRAPRAGPRTRSSHARSRVHALDDVSIEVPTGQWLAILGPNGSGKSTLLRTLAGVDRPDEGTAEIAGHALGARGHDSTTRRALGVVFQTPGLDPLLTVRENLRLAAVAAGAPASRVDAVARELDLADRLGSRVRTLSGGLARRADLARALIHAPAILLLDEPTAALDPGARDEFWRLLRRVRTRNALSLVFSTHAFDEAAGADRVLILDRGRVVADGEPEALARARGPQSIRVEGDDGSARDRLRAEAFAVLEPEPGVVHAIGGPVSPSLLESLLVEPEAPTIPPAIARRSVRISPASLADAFALATGREWSATGLDRSGGAT